MHISLFWILGPSNISCHIVVADWCRVDSCLPYSAAPLENQCRPAVTVNCPPGQSHYSDTETTNP